MIAAPAAPRVMLTGGGAVGRVADVLRQFGLSRPLVVTDPVMVSTGLIGRCLDPLCASGIPAEMFAESVPDPTDTVVEDGIAALARAPFDCIIGFGGGSPMDTAKAIAAQALASGSPGNNPRVPSKDEIIGLYRAVWSGDTPND